MGVAVPDARAALVVHRTGVEGACAVLLRFGWGRQVHHDHLQESLVCREPALHAPLDQVFAVEREVLFGQLDVEARKHRGQLLHLVAHGSVHHLGQRRQDELVERSVLRLAGGRPLLVGTEVVVAPELLAHLLFRNAELFGVHAGKLWDGEGPAVEASGEAHGSVLRADLKVSHGTILVGGDDDVDLVDVLTEGLVEGFLVKLQLQEATVELVDGHDRLDPVCQRLPQHSLRLNAHSFDAIDDHQCPVGDAERGGDLRREVDVPRRVDEVHKELTTFGTVGQLVVGDILDRDLVVERDTGGLDGDPSFGFVWARVGCTLLASRCHGDDPASRQQGICQSRFSMVDMGNDGQVANLSAFLHQGTQLLSGEIDHGSD
mmetsp:Transcript_63104/g.148643  ORF Transcript_63104/g.148643 Transcript_63104/m.148643 type:complete len:375 (+) Transcript_63104:1838-2962(+)